MNIVNVCFLCFILQRGIIVKNNQARKQKRQHYILSVYYIYIKNNALLSYHNIVVYHSLPW